MSEEVVVDCNIRASQILLNGEFDVHVIVAHLAMKHPNIFVELADTYRLSSNQEWRSKGIALLIAREKVNAIRHHRDHTGDSLNSARIVTDEVERFLERVEGHVPMYALTGMDLSYNDKVQVDRYTVAYYQFYKKG